MEGKISILSSLTGNVKKTVARHQRRDAHINKSPMNFNASFGKTFSPHYFSLPQLCWV
jgi:hypothetical protein